MFDIVTTENYQNRTLKEIDKGILKESVQQAESIKALISIILYPHPYVDVRLLLEK